VEYDQDRLELGKGAHHHIDIHDAAAQGHVATDEKGQPLVEIDQAASARLARKVSKKAFDLLEQLGLTFLPCLATDGPLRRPNRSATISVFLYR
jgi:hypothetical protein